MVEPPFLDRDCVPSHATILAGLGPARDRWVRLEDWAREAYGIVGEPLYAGREAGWSVRFRRGGKALFTLMPGRGSLRALVVIGPTAWAGAAALELTSTIRASWDAAHPYPDGRWLWLDVDDDRTVEDIERLVALKSPPPRRRRVAPAPT